MKFRKIEGVPMSGDKQPGFGDRLTVRPGVIALWRNLRVTKISESARLIVLHGSPYALAKCRDEMRERFLVARIQARFDR